MDKTSIWQLVAIVVSAVAAGVTAWMAYETKRMARSASRALDLERMPILGLRDVKVETGNTLVQQGGSEEEGTRQLSLIRYGLELFNAGRVTVCYRVNSLSVTFAGRSPESETYLSRGGHVLPGGSTVFWHSGIRLEPPIEAFPCKGRIVIDCEYTDDSGQNSKPLRESIEVTLDGAGPGHTFHWLNVDDAAEA